MRAEIAEVEGNVKSVKDQIQTAPPDLQLPLHQRLALLDAHLAVLVQKEERLAASAGKVWGTCMLLNANLLVSISCSLSLPATLCCQLEYCGGDAMCHCFPATPAVPVLPFVAFICIAC